MAQWGGWTPVEVRIGPDGATPLTGVTAIEGTDYSTCAIANGAIYCWGQNDVGQLGANSTEAFEPWALPVLRGDGESLTGMSVIDGGESLMCAISIDGSDLWCWGQGHMANSVDQDQPSPVAVLAAPLLSDWTKTAVATAESHTCVIAEMPPIPPAVWCWGFGLFGNLGTGLTDASSEPVVVSQATGLGEAQSLNVGYYVTLALDAEGDVWFWGRAGSHSGDGTSMSFKPTPVVGLDTPCDPAICAP